MAVPAILNDVPATSPYIQYVATSLQTVFPYPFPITQDSDLTVVVNGVTLATDSGYSLTGVGNDTGGNLTFVTGQPVNTIVTLYRNIPIERLTQIAQNAGFSSTIFNAEYNNIYLILQQLQTSGNLALRVPNTNNPAPVTLLTPGVYANKYLSFDSFGNPQPAVLTSSGSVTQSLIAGLLWPQTPQEASAGVTPTNLQYNPDNFDPRRYGAVGNAVADDTSAMNKALSVAGVKGGTVKLPPGYTFRCTADLTPTIGQGFVVNIQGPGWAGPVTASILFDGAAVTNGIYFNGGTFSYSGTVQDVWVKGINGATTGLTFANTNQGEVRRCLFTGFSGRAIYAFTSLMVLLDHVLITGCGSATVGSVEVDTCTTFQWRQTRISGGVTTVGGLLVDRTASTSIVGGNIESVGTQIKIGSKADSTTGCKIGCIRDIDLENPGNANVYIDVGAGLSGSAQANGWTVENVNGSPSGTTTVTAAVRLNQCNGWEFIANNWSVPNGTATHILTGATNSGISIRQHGNLFNAGGIPWVFQNGAQVNAAGPKADWLSNYVLPGANPSSMGNGSGATPDVRVSTTQGGFWRQMTLFNGGATTVTALTGGERGMEVYLSTTNGNTTLTHSTVTANQFSCTAGSNLVMTANKIYHFIFNGTLWVQVQ